MACDCEKVVQPGKPALTAKEIFAKFKVAKAKKIVFRMRWARCKVASECGRLCPQLLKGPGPSQVFCYNAKTNEKILLYPALEREDFVCPLSKF